MTKVFISYAHEDQSSASRLYRELRSMSGIEPWYDKESLGPGMRWKPAIRKNIRESDFFIALLSTKSGLRRGFVHTELNTALEVLKEFPEGQIYLIPIRLDDCPMPVEELKEIQYVDFFPDWDTGMTKVLKSIRAKTPIEPKNIEYINEKVNTSSISVKTYIPSNILRGESFLGYEYKVGIVDLDFGLSKLIQIAQHLNSIQHYFFFSCPKIQLLTDTVKTIDGFSNFVLDLVPSSFYTERQYLKTDLVSCITKHPLAFHKDNQVFYNYFSRAAYEDERFMFISLSQLALFTNIAGVTFEKGIAYLIASQLVPYFTQIGFHSQTRGCLMDFCGMRVDIVQGLKARRLCSWCERKVQNENLKQSIEAILKSDFRI